MRTRTSPLLISILVTTASACQGDRDDEALASAAPTSTLIPQVVPPLDIKTPPDDAIRTSSGLAYKKLAVKNDGAQAHRGDTVRVHYTGWRQSTGETFFTTQGVGQALTLDVDHVAPTFREGLQRLHKGEKAVLWVPPNEGATEMLVYEVEVIDVLPAQVGADKRAPAAEMPPASLKR